MYIILNNIPSVFVTFKILNVTSKKLLITFCSMKITRWLKLPPNTDLEVAMDNMTVVTILDCVDDLPEDAACVHLRHTSVLRDVICQHTNMCDYTLSVLN